MPKQLQKTLSDYLSKKKNKSTAPQQPAVSTVKTLSSPTNWWFRGCRHPKTPSFSAIDHKEKNVQAKNDAATLADVDRFVFENFKSFYSKDDNSETEGNKISNSNIVKKGKKEEIIAQNNEENAGGSKSLSESPRYNIYFCYSFILFKNKYRFSKKHLRQNKCCLFQKYLQCSKISTFFHGTWFVKLFN